MNEIDEVNLTKEELDRLEYKEPEDVKLSKKDIIFLKAVAFAILALVLFSIYNAVRLFF